MIELFSINCLLGRMRFSSVVRVRTMDVAFFLFLVDYIHRLPNDYYILLEVGVESESEFGFLLYDTFEACDLIM